MVISHLQHPSKELALAHEELSIHKHNERGVQMQEQKVRFMDLERFFCEMQVFLLYFHSLFNDSGAITVLARR